MSSAASRISVCIRKRPLNKKETSRGDHDVITSKERSSLTVNEPRVKYDLTKYIEKHNFLFDMYFDESVTNPQVYTNTAKHLLETVFSGGCATCFAYGQTGSGKTYTMMGAQDKGVNGLYVMAAEDLFKCLQADLHYVQASFYEIYAGKVYDLLNGRKKLFVREDAKQNVNIVGVSEHTVKDVQTLMSLMDHGARERASGATAANADSSRSHGILQIGLKQTKNNKTFGKLYFIDLAGNERGADTANCDRQTRMEGADINKSLLALKECIRSLAINSKHIPFRGSKLTMVLKDSFVGKSQCYMIANVSGGSGNCEHTLNTLRYAYRVKELKEPGKAEYEDIPPPKVQQPEEKKKDNQKKQKRPLWNYDPTVGPPPPQQPDPRDYNPPQITEDAPMEVVQEAHDRLMGTIMEEEEDVLAFHRGHIDAKMQLVKQELKLMETQDRGKSSVDEYVTKLDGLLVQQIQVINELRDRLSQFQGHLLEEEILNTTMIKKMQH
eukprot:TRINITY_DN67927_c3_g6_i1.p1 TRINITY_DN67927_c3_g6~~TRINITY_DN67927_c3_g6_i1.p1  ORF type:complete len:496 (-),score=61.30 TRINITY_DN67927_c3_g6_i1:726-2213(-)